MGDFMLTAEPFLGGYSQDFGLVELVEITNLSIVSLAMPLNGQTAFTTAVKAFIELYAFHNFLGNPVNIKPIFVCQINFRGFVA